MVDESIIVSANDRIAPSIAVNFKKIASNAAMAGAAVDQFKAKLAAMGAGNFAAITAGLRGVTAEIMAQSTALDLLAKKQALLGGSFGGAVDVFNVDNIRQSIAQLSLMNSLLSTTAINTAKITAEAAAMAAAYGAAAAAAAKIRPSAIPSGGAGIIGRDMRDATNETNRFNHSQSNMLSLLSGSGGTVAATRLLAGAFGAVGAAAGIATVSIAVIADQYKILTGQLRITTDSMAEYGHVLGEIRRISSETDTSLVSNGKLYGRLSRSLDEHNVINSDKLAIMEAVTASLKANSATTQESASAIIQMSQAFAHGTLQGQEFNSMADVAPSLMRQLASSMGIAYGDMKEAVKDQTVTYKEMVKAWTDPAFVAEMKRQAKEVQLLSGAWQDLKDKVMFAVGEFDNATGISARLIAALNGIGNSVDGAIDKFTKLGDIGRALSPFDGLMSQLDALDKKLQMPSMFNFLRGAKLIASGGIDNLYDKLVSTPRTEAFKAQNDIKKGGLGATTKSLISSYRPKATGDMAVRDKRLAELVKSYQDNELMQSEFESKFNDIVYGKSGSGKKSSGGSTAINDAIRDAQEAQKAYENLIERGLSPGDKILSDMAQHMGKLNETKREHVQLIAYEADELEFLKVINEEVFDQREQLIKRDAELSEKRLAGIKYENERYASLAIGAMDVKKSLMTDEQRILSEAGDRWAQYTEMVKAGFLDQADAVRAYVNEFDENAQMMKDIGKSLQSAFADFLFDPLDKGFEGMVQGFANAIKRMMAEKAALQLTQMAGNWGASVSGSGGLMGMIGSGLAGMFGGVAAPMMPMGVAEGLIGDLVGFDGGGYTGSAPRSGGMDGKGGFMAMLHPQETVVDHTKGQKVTEQKQTNIFNFTINGSPASRETQAQMANRVASVLNSGRRIS